MTIIELRNKSTEQLKDLIIQNKKEILNLNIQRGNGQLKNSARIRTARQEIARIKTIMKQNSDVKLRVEK